MARKQFLVLQQVESEDPGVFSECLERSGLEVLFIRIQELDEVPDSAADFSGALILGGPMNVEEAGRLRYLEEEMKLIRDCRKKKVPVLGICLGAQLLAASFGARVFAGPVREIGWYPVELTEESGGDLLFEGFPDRFTVFQWHGQTFELPRGAVRLAGSPLFENQAFRLGKNLWGLQFHFEITGVHVKNWLQVNAAELRELPYIDRKAVLDGIPKHENACREKAILLFDRFLALVRARTD